MRDLASFLIYITRKTSIHSWTERLHSLQVPCIYRHGCFVMREMGTVLNGLSHSGLATPARKTTQWSKLPYECCGEQAQVLLITLPRTATISTARFSVQLKQLRVTLAFSLFLQLQQVGQSLETCYARYTYPKILLDKISFLLTAKKIIIKMVSNTLFLFKAMLIIIR